MSNFVEIRPRELKPALLELDGISRTTIESHYRLYQGYVAKRNEILGLLATVDLGSANQVYSEVRSLKVDLTFAVGGIKNHEVYFEHLGGAGGDPDGAIGALVERDFGSADAWRADMRATGMAGRGWAWTAFDWDEGRLFNYVGDAQNTFPVWNATPLVALDVYEHAYFLDYQTDRAAYIEAFLRNLDWGVVNGWVEGYRHPCRSRAWATRSPFSAGICSGRCRSGTGCRGSFAARTSARREAGTSARRTSSASTAARSGSRSRCSTWRRGSWPPRSVSGSAGR